MAAKRYGLDDAQWARIALLLGKASDPGRRGSDNRLFVNGCLWVLRSGADWCALPERYGKWKTLHRRFGRWRHAGVWERVFDAMTADRDLMIDSTIVRARQQAASGKGGVRSGAGAFPRRTTTKIHMLADALGRPLRLIVTAGQVGDVVLADKACDSNALRAFIAAIGAEAVTLSNRSRKIAIPHDADIYKHRNRIERCFAKLKHFRRFATRYDRRATILLVIPSFPG